MFISMQSSFLHLLVHCCFSWRVTTTYGSVMSPVHMQQWDSSRGATKRLKTPHRSFEDEYPTLSIWHNFICKSRTYFTSGARSPDEIVSGGTISKSPCILQKPVVYSTGKRQIHTQEKAFFFFFYITHYINCKP